MVFTWLFSGSTFSHLLQELCTPFHGYFSTINAGQNNIRCGGRVACWEGLISLLHYFLCFVQSKKDGQPHGFILFQHYIYHERGECAPAGRLSVYLGFQLCGGSDVSSVLFAIYVAFGVSLLSAFCFLLSFNKSSMAASLVEHQSGLC